MNEDAGPLEVGLARETSCVFAKALLAAAARCECSRRTMRGERLSVECALPPARTNCETLLALLAERGRFALKLTPTAGPLTHMQALRLQCGGLEALRDVLAGPGRRTRDERWMDAHQLLLAAREDHGSLADLPWREIVPRVAAWQPARRRGPAGRA